MPDADVLRVEGRRSWRVTQDDKSHREYRLKTLVIAGDVLVGPWGVLNCPGLPLPGSPWVFGSDIDLTARCKRNAEVTIHQEKEGDPQKWWVVEQIFSTKPSDTCDDESNPLLMRPKVNGGFNRYTKEAVYDRNLDPIETSSHEMVRGPQNEWDNNRGTVKIESNVAVFDLVQLTNFMDCLNDNTMWGYEKRKVKLSGASWTKKYYGAVGTGTLDECMSYVNRILEFDIDKDTFDRMILDEGTKVLQGAWHYVEASSRYVWIINQNLVGVTDAWRSPSNFMRAIDIAGNPVRVPLNGEGIPLTDSSGASIPPTLGSDRTEKYDEVNLFDLGDIPSTIP